MRIHLSAPMFLWVLAICHFGLAYQTELASPPPPETDRRKDVESFELVWRTIRDSHWDSALVGEQWDQYRQELLPAVQAANGIEQVRAIMDDLLQRLGQSHFGIIPRDSYDALALDGGDGQFDVGLTVRQVERSLVVTAVRENSSADEAGILPGWVVEQIRDRTAADLIRQLTKAAQGPQRLETLVGLVAARATSGKLNQSISFVFTDSGGVAREMQLVCRPAPGELVSIMNLPPTNVYSVTKTLPGGLGYFYFNAFLDPKRTMTAYRDAVRDPTHQNGIVIDVRGNIGGLAAMTMGMAGEFVTKPQVLGTMTMKNTKLQFVANPRANPISCPVAVLVDECSISSAEILAGGLQDLGLARIFGSRTAGLALPSVIIKLPNGDGFQYAVANYESADGATLEVNGVEPDEPVSVTRQKLLVDPDPVLTAAVGWIQNPK